MARYIDQDVAVELILSGKLDEDESLVECPTECNASIEHAAEVVSKMPTADVVEVVRCKDCKHRHQTTCPFLIANAYKTSADDDFCSRGEGRTDDGEIH